MQKDGNRRIKSVDNAFDIIDFLHNSGGKTLSEVTEHMGLARSTTHDYIATLADRNVVVKQNDKWHLGYALLDYGGTVKARTKLYQIAKPELDRIAKETGLTVYLALEDNGELFRITSVSWEDTTPVENRDGKREGWHATALGKAILSQLPNSTVDSILSNKSFPKLTDKTLTNPDELRESLETIREQGYATNDAEYYPGWKGIAVPIVVEGPTRGAISVSGPKTRVENSQEDLVQMLQISRDQIEAAYSRN